MPFAGNLHKSLFVTFVTSNSESMLLAKRYQKVLKWPKNVFFDLSHFFLPLSFFFGRYEHTDFMLGSIDLLFMEVVRQTKEVKVKMKQCLKHD